MKEQQINQESEKLKDGLLSQNFEDEVELGTGTKGNVVQVKHKIDTKEYAIKMLIGIFC